MGFGSFVALSGGGDGGSTESAIQPAGAGSSTTAAASATGSDASGDSSSTSADATGNSVVPSAVTTLSASPAPDGAYVQARLNLDAGPNPGLFTLSGRVPDAQTAELLRTAAEVSYAPYVTSDLEIDPTVESAPWLAPSARLIGLLPSVTDGTIRVSDKGIEVDARSPNPEYLALFEGALTQLGGGMPVTMVNKTITDLVPPQFEADVMDGKVTLSGEVPADAVKALLEGGAAAAYGQDNVASTLTVNDKTYTSFWMYTMPGIFQLFTPFPRYNLQVVNGQASGTLQGGVGFAINSTDISPEAAKVLDIGVSIMARDLSVAMTVTGHTDATGPDDLNQTLSEDRARSVVAYLVSAGIEPERLTAEGKGESEPIAPNSDPAGRAVNRRVEFSFGPAGG
ncbi:MAG: OmpA family protein [Acidimicrobiales bacterium]